MCVLFCSCKLVLPGLVSYNIQSNCGGALAAVGAVAIAAVGVWGVFKLSLAVAQGTGRSMIAGNSGEQQVGISQEETALPAPANPHRSPEQGPSDPPVLPLEPQARKKGWFY
jgi:hypothetical protein